ncbi:MAG: HD domain-containing protein [Candidatus Bathyarchaeia archaeon]|jgi:HD superfamily phosphohydrolase
MAKKRNTADSPSLEVFNRVGPAEEKKEIGDLIKELLAPRKTIRDAVHKDIFVTHLETAIIDTQTFQRLRRLKQLGLTNLVYPSANHTRLEHSIGTLFMAENMICKINLNPYPEIRIEEDDRFIIRLCALLHDVGNLPFGHTLEDEGGLFDSQWSQDRLTYFLGDNSEIGKAIIENRLLRKLSDLGQSRFNPNNVLIEIRKTLKSIEEKKVSDLARPYIADIVGNTLCADLLDYSRRDIYFTGLTAGYDDRLLSYLFVTKFNGKYRLVLRLIKPKKGQIRRDVLSELMDLLRLRYSLSEKVYYHKTKMIASGMLISAVTSMTEEMKLSEDNLYTKDDDTLLEYLYSNGNQIAKHLINRLRERKLYKTVYDLSYSQEGITQSEYQRKNEIIQELHNPTIRYEKERMLERMSAGSTFVRNNPGSILIYCPSSKMGLKEIKALVNWGMGEHDIGPLTKIKDERIRGEIKTSITDKHRELWRMLVIVDPEIPDIEKCYIRGDCEDLFGLPSGSKEYGVKPYTHYVDRLAIRWEQENGNDLLRKEIEAVKLQLLTRGLEGSKVLSFDDFCHQIQNLRSQEKRD